MPKRPQPDQDRASKKLWDSAAWRDAGFFLHYLRPHFNVFIPALIALAITLLLISIPLHLEQ
jgi:ATP-binding cassette subfamily B protein